MLPELRADVLCRDDTRWRFFVSSTPNSVDDFARRYADQHRGVVGDAPVVRMFRGQRSATPERLLQEWAAALPFPWYCGYTWDGFDECIGDLEWLPGSCYLFFVTQLDLVLPGLDRDFGIFIDILKGAAQAWKVPNRANTGEPTAPFTVIFQTEPERAAAALNRLQAAGADPFVVRFSDDNLRL
ncbi:MAG TPA: barstar family protein [Thermomicrobiaceae bacterium]|nr:barstar family protein [Thermomicrobiaceae bacterium]